MMKLDSGRLRSAMDRRGLTIRTLAVTASVSPATVMTALQGRSVSLRSLAAIARGLDSVAELPHLDLLTTAPSRKSNGSAGLVGTGEPRRGGTDGAANSTG